MRGVHLARLASRMRRRDGVLAWLVKYGCDSEEGFARAVARCRDAGALLELVRWADPPLYAKIIEQIEETGGWADHRVYVFASEPRIRVQCWRRVYGPNPCATHGYESESTKAACDAVRVLAGDALSLTRVFAGYHRPV